MLVYYTNGNVLKIKATLRHKSVLNTMKYIRAIQFKDKTLKKQLQRHQKRQGNLAGLAGQNTTNWISTEQECISTANQRSMVFKFE